MFYEKEILGGLLIGLGCALPLAFDGRVAGASGYAEGSLRPLVPAGRTSLFFMLGVISAGIGWRALGGLLPESGEIPLGTMGLANAGLLVGFGSRLGGGCTSGHGVCGLGRLSFRSFVAVLIFMTVAMLTAYCQRVW